jgi:LemA protein
MLLLLVVAIAVAAYVIVAYNALTKLRQLARNAWADIDVQLKRRHELIPALVQTVKGHAGYERGTLEAVVEARNRATAVRGPAEAGIAEQALATQVRQLFALAESYPELRAAESYLSLQRTLTEIEDHIQGARRYYNAVVRDLNTKIEQVPSNVVASIFGFRREEFFGLTDATESQAPRVQL